MKFGKDLNCKWLCFSGLFLCLILPGTLHASSWILGGDFNISTFSTTNQSEASNVYGEYKLNSNLSYSTNPWSAAFEIGRLQNYSYEMEDGQDGDWKNPIFSVKRPFKNILNIDSIAFALNSSLPLSRDSRRRDFKGSLGIGLSLTENFAPWLSFTQSFGYTQAFYEYDIADDGEVLSPHIFSSNTLLKFKYIKGFYSLLNFNWEHSISYQNTGKSGTVSALAGGYEQKHWDVALGFLTKAGTLNSEGSRNQVVLQDPRYTQVFLSLSYRI